MRNRSPSSRAASVNDTALSRGRPERFKPAAWYRGDVGTVSSWTDKSGGGHHLLQATAGLQPTIAASATPSGKPAFRADGVDDFMGPAAFTLNQPHTVLIAFKMITVTAAGSHDAVYDGNTAAVACLLNISTPANQMFAGGAVNYLASVANAVYAQTSQVWNGASSIQRVAGTQVATGDAGAGNPAGVTLFALADGSRSANAEIAEFIVYARALSTEELVRNDKYQRAYAGTP